jgi:hypothetical protein
MLGKAAGGGGGRGGTRWPQWAEVEMVWTLLSRGSGV